MTKTISPRQLAQLQSADPSVELLDVRTPAEFQEAHVDFARNVPLDQLDPAALRREPNKEHGRPLYVICRSGSRARQACEKLTRAGLDAVNVEGGISAWDAAGLPVVRGQKTMSLERQVRIAAGTLVLLGAVLALLVHPYFAALSGFVGAGLIFAGMTDTCGMGLLLARMPWNRACAAGQAGCSVHQ
jgi:rhodanese-related sulfurtransferase